MSLSDVSSIINNYTGRARVVLEYSLLMKRLVGEAKQSGFSRDSWSPVAELVATDQFRRVGNFKEVMDWPAYITFLTDWARSSEWDCSFRRVSEVGDVVFLELEERSKVGDYQNVVNSVSVYAFNPDDKIRHIDVYLQMEMPSPEMLKSYVNVDLNSGSHA